MSKYPLSRIHELLDLEGVALLHSFSLLDEKHFQKIALKKSYHPLHHKYEQSVSSQLTKLLRKELATLEAFGSFDAQLLVFGPEEYSIVHDDAKEKGLLGFLSLTDWNYEDGGYIAIDHEPIELPKGSLLLVQGEFHWFVKRVSYHAQKKQMFIVFRKKE